MYNLRQILEFANDYCGIKNLCQKNYAKTKCVMLRKSDSKPPPFFIRNHNTKRQFFGNPNFSPKCVLHNI